MIKTLFIRLPDLLTIVLVALLLIVLPSVYTNDLMLGTVSGKTFFFLYAMLFASILLAVKIMLNSNVCIRLSIIDILLLIWIVYVLLNGFIKQMPVSNRLLEFFGLIVYYIVLRQIEPSKYEVVLIPMIIGGFIQAVYGNLQLWGYFPSHHSLFRITGSFFNPGPFAGYLISVLPVVLGTYLFQIRPLTMLDKKLNHTINLASRHVYGILKSIYRRITSWIASISLMVILLILIPSQSRASWIAAGISSAILLVIRYQLMQWVKKKSRFKRGAVLLFFTIIMGLTIFGLFRLKIDSSNGRLLIWKVTNTIIFEHPVTGVGFDRFKAFYMIAQASYFKKTIDSPDAMVAGDVSYAFNDFLQLTAENGLLGLILMLFILVFAFRVASIPFNGLVWIAKAGIIGISIFAFFSYPAQILPIKMSITLYFACLSSLAKKRTLKVYKMLTIVKSVLAVCIVLCFIYTNRYLKVERVAWKNWNRAYYLYSIGNYSGCLAHFEKAWLILKTNGEYLTNYGKALSMAGEHEQSIKVLQKAALYYPNIVVYSTLGDSYKELLKFIDAEQSYFTASYMNPSRFYTKYLLAKLYDETGQSEKAITIARELIHKEVKIKSIAIIEIREEMEKILQKYQN